MPSLFDELTIKSVTLRNRIGVSPMCQYSSTDGHANDWHLVHLGARAVGGAGLIIAEATAVAPEGRISPRCGGLWADSQIEPLARITRFLKEHNAVPGIQIAHAGRKGSAARPWEGDHHLTEEEGGWQTLGPSPVVFGEKLWKVPKEMSVDEIKQVQENFASAAVRAVESGYQWIELHAAHGYLCHNFYSPLSNKRTDQYGGDFLNRVRFTVETVQAIRRVWPEKFPFAVRLSSTDWVEGGWTLEETIELAKILKSEGVDLIDCSSGFNSPDHKVYPFGPGWQAHFALEVREKADVLTAAVGLIAEPVQANEIIAQGKADIVLMGREMLKNPYWPLKAARELGFNVKKLAPAPYMHWM